MEIFDEKLAVKRITKIITDAYKKSKNISKEGSRKELNDVVTDVDLFMEKSIIAGILKYYPTHSIHAEESGETKAQAEGDFFEWLIDPIDGTINFAAGLPIFGVTVALQKNGETILGVSIMPELNEVYTVIKSEGAFCNGKKMQVSNRSDLRDSVVTLCLTSHYNQEHTDKAIEVIRKISNHVRGLRIIVCAVAETCWIAGGKIDALVNIKASKGLGSAAGVLMIKESGGEVTNTLGNPRAKIDTMICSNAKIHEELVKLLNSN